MRKYWRKDSAVVAATDRLPPEQTIVQAGGQYAALHPIFPIIGGIIDKDATNSTGVVNQQHVSNWQAALNDRIVEVLQREAFERVSLQDANEAHGPQRPDLRLGRRRVISGLDRLHASTVRPGTTSAGFGHTRGLRSAFRMSPQGTINVKSHGH
jgi:hypothetical protein